MNLRESLVFDIKKKRELSSLDDEFVSELVENYFLKNKKIRNLLENHPRFQKSKDYKIVIKELRKILHEIYGVFQLGNKEKLLETLENKAKKKNKIDNEIIEIHKNILSLHRSTKERLNDYGLIYKKILNNDVKTILDISSGLNPCSFPWMNIKNIEYTATELSGKDCEFLNSYFRIMKKFGLNGKAVKINLLKENNFPKVDVCFLFKVLDTFEGLKRGISKDILKKINCEVLVVSFPTKTLSGKILGKKRLTWFGKIVKNYETFEIENEIFYIVKNRN